MAGDYLGCWQDDNLVRDMDGSRTDSDQMTIEFCQNLCGSTGFKYSGLQYSLLCFCDDDFGGNYKYFSFRTEFT